MQPPITHHQIDLVGRLHTLDHRPRPTARSPSEGRERREQHDEQRDEKNVAANNTQIGQPTARSACSWTTSTWVATRTASSRPRPRGPLARNEWHERHEPDQELRGNDLRETTNAVTEAAKPATSNSGLSAARKYKSATATRAPRRKHVLAAPSAVGIAPSRSMEPGLPGTILAV